MTFLENQCHTTCKARAQILGLINEEKVPGGFFDACEETCHINACVRSYDRDWLAECLLVLEDYAASFQREMTFEVKVRYNMDKPKLDRIYSSMPREMAIDELHGLFAENDFRTFRKEFRVVFDDMEMQFMEIMEAREHLFMNDIIENPTLIGIYLLPQRAETNLLPGM
ncbi:hypothetical protein BDZ45DRAFT_752726 [Acephala macrosclerotiorum]|nr:hypothetical protein BDZ45DRAFT_752726 [Acephala macrosclerotiorum]